MLVLEPFPKVSRGALAKEIEDTSPTNNIGLDYGLSFRFSTSQFARSIFKTLSYPGFLLLKLALQFIPGALCRLISFLASRLLKLPEQILEESFQRLDIDRRTLLAG